MQPLNPHAAPCRSGWQQKKQSCKCKPRMLRQALTAPLPGRRASPPVRLANRAYQPVKREYDHQFRRFAFVYADFTSEETKRKWKWSRQMEREAKFWKSLVVFFQGGVLLPTSNRTSTGNSASNCGA